MQKTLQLFGALAIAATLMGFGMNTHAATVSAKTDQSPIVFTDTSNVNGNLQAVNWSEHGIAGITHAKQEKTEASILTFDAVILDTGITAFTPNNPVATIQSPTGLNTGTVTNASMKIYTAGLKSTATNTENAPNYHAPALAFAGSFVANGQAADGKTISS